MLYTIMITGWLRLTRLMVERLNMDAMDSTVSYMESTIHLQTTILGYNLIPMRAERFNT
jgi:hypothetical protein